MLTDQEFSQLLKDVDDRLLKSIKNELVNLQVRYFKEYPEIVAKLNEITKRLGDYVIKSELEKLLQSLKSQSGLLDKIVFLENRVSKLEKEKVAQPKRWPFLK